VISNSLILSSKKKKKKKESNNSKIQILQVHSPYPFQKLRGTPGHGETLPQVKTLSMESKTVKTLSMESKTKKHKCDITNYFDSKTLKKNASLCRKYKTENTSNAVINV
jgi:phosphoribosylanthranilate isomerase